MERHPRHLGYRGAVRHGPGHRFDAEALRGGSGVTIVTGGEAGTAEGDFASCLVWSSRPGNELPVLMIVTNNGWGISTPACSQHGERHVSDRGKAFGIPGEVVDGNDPVACWHAIERMDYCRQKRRPYLLEAMVSRLHGHSSSSGAHRVDEPDCIVLLEEKLIDGGVLTLADASRFTRRRWRRRRRHWNRRCADQPQPTAADVERHTYADSPVDAVYPGDYTGLPS